MEGLRVNSMSGLVIILLANCQPKSSAKELADRFS